MINKFIKYKNVKKPLKRTPLEKNNFLNLIIRTSCFFPIKFFLCLKLVIKNFKTFKGIQRVFEQVPVITKRRVTAKIMEKTLTVIFV